MPYRKQAAFTMIELLVVIAIIGILAGIAIPAYNSYLTDSRMTEAEKNISALRMAEEEYYLENHSYFQGGSNAALNTNSGGLWEVQGTDGVVNFDYTVTTTATGFTITATGKAGTPVAGKTRTETY